MTKHNHTPGPWWINYPPDSYMTVCGEAGWWVCAEVDNLANARLIAAAPELLDAGRYAHDVLDEINTDDDAVREAVELLRDAIAKATGAEAQPETETT